jgi:hypothetical protein
MLLDTSGLLCLHHQPEPFHEEACRAYRAASVRLTHGYVLAEDATATQAGQSLFAVRCGEFHLDAGTQHPGSLDHRPPFYSGRFP